MDKIFWKHIVETDFALPEGYSAAQLTPELSGFLGSTDVEVRDPFGYTILTHWIVRDGHYSPDELRTLRDEWLANLDKSIGEDGTDSVFLRSFSMLMLSIIVYRDNQESFLRPSEIRALVEKTLAYFASEQDVRGFVPGKGWAHSVAHMADALKFMARNPATGANDHRQMLDAIVEKLILPIQYTYVHSEDERLALAVLDIIKRGTLSINDWSNWLEKFTNWRSTWEDGDFVPTIHAPWYNSKNFLRSLYFRLEFTPDLPTPAAEVKARLLNVIKAWGQ